MIKRLLSCEMAAGTLAAFGMADIDRNGIVNGADLTIVLAAWGACP